MNWKSFWRWVDEDFNHVRPYSLILFWGLAALPLLLAFLFDAPISVVEIARGASLVGVLIVTAYYIFRAAKNIVQSFKDTFGPKSGTGNGSDHGQ